MIAPHYKQVPEPVSGGLILSYKCTAECRHCMYGCSPEWSADWISDHDLQQTINALVPYILPGPGGPEAMSLSHGLHFTGGEPFMNFDLLLRATELASEAGIPSTFVETNCYWCGDDEKTMDMLVALRERGMAGIMISVNPFYLEYVPFERTNRCIACSLEVFGRNTAVYQADYYRRFEQWGVTGTVELEKYLEMEREEDLFRNVEFFSMGRAPYAMPRRFFPCAPAYRFFGRPCVPPMARPWHNHFDNYGNYMPGFCGGISYGDIRDIDKLLREGIDPDSRPVLALLMEEDLEGLFNLAKEKGYESLEEGYCSKCHVCLDIRAHLARGGEFEELAPGEFYEHVKK